MAVTMKEISDLCGVSPGTVDRALNNRPGISVKTKARILEVAKQLNYQPDLRARSLARGRTMTIGVILFDLHNRSFAQMMSAIETRSRELGYYIDLGLSGKDPDMEQRIIERFVQRKVDGLILFTVNRGVKFVDYLKKFNIPIVTIGNYVSDELPYVGINDRQAMKDAAALILEKGFQKIIYICPPLSFRGKTNIHTQEERVEGFLEAVSQHPDVQPPKIIIDKDYLRILDAYDWSNEPRTAVLCSCDYYALEVMNLLKSKKLRIPQDVGLMGFDNIDVLKYVVPALHTVEYAVEEMGKKAVDALVRLVENEEKMSIPPLAYQIILGESI